MWYIIPADELYHHGILGQKWGKRNGPPYPLGSGDHSAREKKAGWQKSLDKGKSDSYNKKQKTKSESENKARRGLTDGQKRALKIGAAAVAAGLAAYGGYKLYQSGKLDPVIAKFAKKGEILAGEVPDSDNVIHFSPKEQPIENGFRMLKESEPLADTIKKVNPHLGDPTYKNNCTYCAVAAALRQRKMDVVAKDTNQKGMNLLGVVEDCFKISTVKKFEGSGNFSAEFASSPQNAANLLVKRFGQNASGVVGIDWTGGGGHAFNWEIKNGVVTFYDAQQGKMGKELDRYWNAISPTGYLQLARLDNAEIIEAGIREIIS